MAIVALRGMHVVSRRSVEEAWGDYSIGKGTSFDDHSRYGRRSVVDIPDLIDHSTLQHTTRV
jgi:hypothetical protein